MFQLFEKSLVLIKQKHCQSNIVPVCIGHILVLCVPLVYKSSHLHSDLGQILINELLDLLCESLLILCIH